MAKSESNSVTNQRMLIEKYIEEHDDLKLCGTYIDDGFTGTNFDRPQMKAMMEDIDAGKIDCIVCKDLSRFGRERIETGTLIIKTFREKGIRFIAINDNYDSLTADGAETHIVMPIKALTNDSFSRDISVKVRSSQSVKRERGEYVGSFAPYGYKKLADNRNQLEPDEPAAEIVRDIFAKKVSGYSASAIAVELNELGIPSPAEYKKMRGEHFTTGFRRDGRSKWSAQTVIRILKNEVYMGTLAQGKRERISYKVRKQIEVPRKDWIRCENTHEALISKAVFDTVQNLMDRDTICVKGKRTSYLYTGILFCGDCGGSMIRRSNYQNKDGQTYYICSTKNSRNRCSRHSIREDDLNNAVLEFLKDLIEELQNRMQVAEEVDKMSLDAAQRNCSNAEIEKLKQELESYSALKASLYQDLKNGLISKKQFCRYRDEYSLMEAEMESAIRKQEEEANYYLNREELAVLRLSNFQKRLNVSDMDRSLLVTFIDRILVFEGSVINIKARVGNVTEDKAVQSVRG